MQTARNRRALEGVTNPQTTDATPLNILLWTPKKSKAHQVRARITATKDDGSKAATFGLYANVRSDSSGVLTLLSAGADTTGDAESGFAPTAEINVSGSSIIAILTGIGGTTINWVVEAEVI